MSEQEIAEHIRKANSAIIENNKRLSFKKQYPCKIYCFYYFVQVDASANEIQLQILLCGNDYYSVDLNIGKSQELDNIYCTLFNKYYNALNQK